MQNVQFTQEDYNELYDLFHSGDITQSSKTQLERYAIMLSRPAVSNKFGPAQFPQVCETIRMLMAVKISEENNKEATKISRVALIVAIVALIATVIQTIVSAWPLCYPKGQGTSQFATPQQTTQTAKPK